MASLAEEFGTTMVCRALAVSLFVVLSSQLGSAGKPDAGGQLRQLRFSWDGKYVLAQDDYEVTVLTVDPFTVFFRIPARDATLAQFAPDSREVTFVSSVQGSDAEVVRIVHGTPLVETWSLTKQAQMSSVKLPVTCGTASLTADARTVACDDYQGTLSVFDVGVAEKLLEIRRFVQPVYTWIRLQRYEFPPNLGDARLDFTPDGRFLLAAGYGGSSGGRTIIWDVRNRRFVKLKGGLSVLRGNSSADKQYAFIGSEKLAISCSFWMKKYIETTRVIAFPGGENESKAKIPWSRGLLSAADPAYLIVVGPLYPDTVPAYYGPVKLPRSSPGAAAVELATGQMIATGTSVIDVFGSRYVAEVRPGEVGLYERDKGLQATVVLHQK